MEKSSTPLDNSTNDVDIASADEWERPQCLSACQIQVTNAFHEINVQIFTFITYQQSSSAAMKILVKQL